MKTIFPALKESSFKFLKMLNGGKVVGYLHRRHIVGEVILGAFNIKLSVIIYAICLPLPVFSPSFPLTVPYFNSP